MKILLVTSRHPLPPWRGNQVRILQWLSALAEDDVTLLCPMSSSPEGVSLACRVVTWPAHGRGVTTGVVRAAVTGRPLQEGLYAVPQATRALRGLLTADTWDVVVVQMVRCGWAMDEVVRLATRPAILFDAVDSMALHYRRAAESSSVPRAWAERLEATRCGRRESRLALAATAFAAVCRRDLEVIGGRRDRHVVVPVAAEGTAAEPAVTSEPVIALTGNLGYRPTRTAVEWFADRVWPRVRQSVQDARWIVAGARPSAAVRRLANRPGIEVRADVADLGAVLGTARVAIAPMASGSGIPMKVLEAWAAGVPVVATPRAVEALEGGLEACAVRPRADIDGWIRVIVELLTDAEAAAEVGRRGRRAWADRYAPAPVAQAIRHAVRSAVAWHHGSS